MQQQDTFTLLCRYYAATPRLISLFVMYKGNIFNSPNDLWPHPKGPIYFTDPRYGRIDNLPQDGEHVYCYFGDGKQVKRVIDDMVRPNGVIGSRDGRILYVAGHGANKIYAYTINSDWTLSDKWLFAAEDSDGMTIDSENNIYLTGEMVSVYDSKGNKIETIEVPEGANLAASIHLLIFSCGTGVFL